MNRYAFLLPVALSLAAISLAQPAHAQWVKGRTYYDTKNTTQSLDAYSTITTDPVGTVKITANPPGYPYSSSGKFGGIVLQDYTWTGDPGKPSSGFSGTRLSCGQRQQRSVQQRRRPRPQRTGRVYAGISKSTVQFEQFICLCRFARLK